jgi:hypothetical protein
MVPEEGPGVHGETGRLDQCPDPHREVAPIGVVPENGPTLEAAHHHVVEDPRGIQARLKRHWQARGA